MFLEIDEHGHEDRDPSCEVAKIIDEQVSVQQHYSDAIVVHFRFNPSEFDRKVNLEERITKTASDICLFLSGAGEDWRSAVPHVLYYFYPKKSYFQIEFTLNKAANAVRVLVVDDEKSFRSARDLHDIKASWVV